MKRLFLVLFIMIALAGFGFADPTVVLTGTVEEGGGVTPPGGGDESLSSGAIKSYLYYDVAGAGELKDIEPSGLMTSLSDGEAEHQLADYSFDLTGTKDDPDQLYLYIFAGANAKSTATLDITFSCTDGWVMTSEPKPTGYEEQSIPLKFSTTTLDDDGVLTVSATDKALSDTSSSAEITIEAAQNARVGTSKIVSKTEVSWEQKAYYVGNYSATITVKVEPGEV